MPAGVSWPRYTKMLVASVLSMFAGAEVVHRYYRPDLVNIKDISVTFLYIKDNLSKKQII